MKKTAVLILMSCLMMLLSGFNLFERHKQVKLEPQEQEAAKRIGLSLARAAELKAKKLYEFTPRDVNDYLPLVQELYPDLPERIIHLARKAIGQPYKIYLLGEFPFELYDSDPLFCLDK
ncbi:MAG: hypothetical protein N2246_11630, partial [Candidatus Sumerlaeia bacterium]|nr:hypothetical protein [Candidatus Sumerlaeia bacterium]